MRPTDNPKNRFVASEVVWDEGEAPLAQLHVHEEHAKRILSENDSPDLPFRFSVNPYRGCQHACAYCYARPSHQYWGFGAGTDFEREIVVKVNAPALLREAFARPSWRGDPLTFSGNTDCYQPLEGRYRLTRALLSICAEHKNPVSLITKSTLVRRDLDVLGALSAVASLHVFVSLAFADEDCARALEPGAPSVQRRLDTIAALAEAGIATGVAVAPIIPGVNDGQLAQVLERAQRAGARRAFHTLLRLPGEVKPVFLTRLRESLPHAATKVEHALLELRGGALDDPRFGARMRGQGPRWQAIDELFALQCKRLGLDTGALPEAPPTFERPGAQLRLF
jgi:DNA repair photolyase